MATPPPISLLVNELYASIQGESTHAGRACVFVRLTGCPLRCAWCDSEFSFSGGERLTLETVLERVKSFGLHLVEVTGGEPLAQPGCLTLLAALCDAGYEVLLETSGAFDVAAVDPRVTKIVDLKCPASGEAQRNLWTNLDHIGPCDELKFVIATPADYDWAREVLAREAARIGERTVLFSAVTNGPESVTPTQLAEWIVRDRVPARLQVQLHKHLWPGRQRAI